MRFVIQRVNFAKIECFEANKIVHTASIGKWLVIYLGIWKDDIWKDLDKSKILKILKLPLFDDINWKITQSVLDVNWELLLIPNFTLYWRNKKWINIDYTYSAPFKDAKNIFKQVVDLFNSNIKLQVGIFGSYMKIQSEVDWPVNFIYEI